MGGRAAVAGRPQPYGGDGLQAGRLDQGVDEVRGADHDRGHLGGAEARQRRGDAAGDVLGRGGLDGGENLAAVADEGGVGVGAAHVDADAHKGEILQTVTSSREPRTRPSLPATM
ncbi:hypothetical protein GCM10020219_055240 [Nonomuraea dietziae]